MFTSKTSTVKRKTRGKTTTLLDLWRQRKKCYLDAKSRNSTLQNAALGSFSCFQDQNKREHAAGETSPANNLKDLLVPRIGPCTKGENMNTLTVEWSTKQVLSGTGRAEGKATRDRLSSLLSQSATIKRSVTFLTRRMFHSINFFALASLLTVTWDKTNMVQIKRSSRCKTFVRSLPVLVDVWSATLVDREDGGCIRR